MVAKRKARPRQTRGRRTAVQPEVQEEVKEEVGGTLFDLGGDDKVVYVWRIHPVSKKMVYQYKLLPEEATEEEIQRLSGGGKYTCREKERNEGGVMVFGRQRSVEVAGAPREPLVPKSTVEELAPTGSVPSVAVSPDKGGTTIDDVLTAGILRLFTSQAEASETQAKMYQAMIARPQTDWTGVVVALVPIVTAMIEKKDGGPNPLQMVTEIAKLVKQSTSSAGDFKDTLAAMNDVLDIKERTGPQAEDPLTAMAGQLPKILEVISSEQKQGRTPTAEDVQRRLAQQSASNEGAANVPPHQMFLKRFSPMLRRWATEAKDPSLLGEFIIQSVPEKFHGALKEFLQRDDAEELVFQYIPDLRNYPAFTKECFGTMADFFEPEEEEPEVTDEVDQEGVGHQVEETVEETIEENETLE